MSEKQPFELSLLDLEYPREAQLYFVSVLLRWWQSKPLFISQSGYMGIAPHLFEGDTGIIRWNGIASNFITYAYIRGIVHGEAWNNPKHTLEELILT
jgi:hypothetical protein